MFSEGAAKRVKPRQPWSTYHDPSLAANVALIAIINNMQDMNAVAADSLASLLLPAQGRTVVGGQATTGRRSLGSVIEAAGAHPGYRLFTLRSVPSVAPASIDFTTFTWTSTLRRLHHMFATGRQYNV